MKKELHSIIDKDGFGRIVDENNDYYKPKIKTVMTRQQIIDLFIDGMSCWHDNKEQLDFIDYVIKLDKNQKELIKFLKNKIKEYKKYVVIYKKHNIGNTKLYCEAKLFAYQETLDFIEKSDKE